VGNLNGNGGATSVQEGGCTTCYEAGITITSDRNIAEKSEEIRRYLLAFAEAQQWTRENPAEAAEITARWLPGTDAAVMASVLETAPLDMRMSKNVLFGINTYTVPTLLRLGKIDNAVDANDMVDPSFMIELLETGAEYFEGMDPIPADVLFE
jgi:NitT/TauT family transport system substrate-binding protein/sulfonate transport system substrate-binding protein